MAISKQQNMSMVLQALKNAGLNDNQARILGSEIGRENGFQDRYLWGYHSDPKNKKVNIGIISWQGNRGKAVEKALRTAGLIKNGKIIKGQASLDVMAKYLVHEIKTVPDYKATKTQFLDNPNVDYHTGTRVLGKNFIRWRYDDPKYAHHHKKRDSFYAQLGGIKPNAGQSTTPQNLNLAFSAPSTASEVSDAEKQVVPTYNDILAANANQQFHVPLAPPPQGFPQLSQPKDLLGFQNDAGILGLNFDLLSVLQGMGATQQQITPLLPTPSL